MLALFLYGSTGDHSKIDCGVKVMEDDPVSAETILKIIGRSQADTIKNQSDMMVQV
jgi:hypothetical protein